MRVIRKLLGTVMVWVFMIMLSVLVSDVLNTPNAITMSVGILFTALCVLAGIYL